MILTGNHAVSYGVKAARAEVVAAYPITPQTQIIEKLAELIAKGEMNARYIRVESEHSAMTACISAEACGARAFTATSSHGLAYMSEMVFWAGLGRFPVTMAVVTRTLAPPWSIWNEHTDILAQRDSGWIMMMCESAQEAYDTAIQAFRIAEDERVLQPVMYGLDSFSLSHTAENVDLLDQGVVDGYLPRLDPSKLPVYIDPDRPITFGNLLGPDRMMEFRHLIKEAFDRAERVIDEAAAEYSKIAGRPQTGLFENYRCSDAEVVAVATGASSGDVKDAVDGLRDKGVKAGMIRLKTIRPFPGEEIKEAIGGVKVVATIDRDYSFGFGGILGRELSAYLSGDVFRYIAGLGGRDLTIEDFEGIINGALQRAEEGKGDAEEVWWGLKEVE
ncbi:MAG: pyruvate ferredoxin oxidoreductase [Candidatus Verstraetearchaeota archaeon]|nr:pyruvate ferredoxin oxidoreductase [Candidatus Verstraetearchaeota archaeon]